MIKKYKQIILYLIFGGLSTILNIGLYFILSTYIFDIKKSLFLVITNIITWLITILFVFITNRYLVFKSNGNIQKEFFRFVIARVSTLIFELVSMYVLVSLLQLNDKIIKVVVQFFIIVFNYILSKLKVFKS